MTSTKLSTRSIATLLTAKSVKADLEKHAAALAAREILIETNEGTYSPIEAARATGSGDPRYNTYRVYASVGGGKRREGCAKDVASGYARYLGSRELSMAKKELASLRAQIKVAK